MKIQEMPWEELRKLLRVLGPEIGQLAKRGDRFAKSVMERYRYAFDHPNDTHANFELRVAIDDYLRRDLITAERADLQAKYGHLVDDPEAEQPTRIFVPAAIRKQ